MDKESKLSNQKGFASSVLLVLVAVVGLAFYLGISSTFPFKDKLYSLLYPKPKSQASEGTRIELIGNVGVGVTSSTQTYTNNIQAKLVYVPPVPSPTPSTTTSAPTNYCPAGFYWNGNSCQQAAGSTGSGSYSSAPASSSNPYSPAIQLNTTGQIKPGDRVTVSWSNIPSPLKKDAIYLRRISDNSVSSAVYAGSCSTSFATAAPATNGSCDSFGIPNNASGDYKLEYWTWVDKGDGVQSTNTLVVSSLSMTIATAGSTSTPPPPSFTASSAPVPVDLPVCPTNVACDQSGSGNITCAGETPQSNTMISPLSYRCQQNGKAACCPQPSTSTVKGAATYISNPAPVSPTEYKVAVGNTQNEAQSTLSRSNPVTFNTSEWQAVNDGKPSYSRIIDLQLPQNYGQKFAVLQFKVNGIWQPAVFSAPINYLQAPTPSASTTSSLCPSGSNCVTLTPSVGSKTPQGSGEVRLAQSGTNATSKTYKLTGEFKNLVANKQYRLQVCAEDNRCQSSGTMQLNGDKTGAASLPANGAIITIPNTLNISILKLVDAYNFSLAGCGLTSPCLSGLIQNTSTSPQPSSSASPVAGAAANEDELLCKADIDGSGYIAIQDFSLLTLCNGKKATEIGTNNRVCFWADLNSDGVVNEKDANDVIKPRYGKKVDQSTCGKVKDETEKRRRADIDGDNSVTKWDSSLMKLYLQGQDKLLGGWGDIDLNKQINNQDAQEVLKLASELPSSTGEKFTAEQKRRADVNRDGRVTSADALLVERYAKNMDQVLGRSGDVNGDGKVTDADADEALRLAVKLPTSSGKPFNPAQTNFADVNRQGGVTSVDALLIKRFAKGMDPILGAFGDVNGDGKVSDYDVTEIERIAGGSWRMAASCQTLVNGVAESNTFSCGNSRYNKVYDLNKDKNINNLDLTKVRGQDENWCRQMLNNTVNPCSSAASSPSTTSTPVSSSTPPPAQQAGSNRNPVITVRRSNYAFFRYISITVTDPDKDPVTLSCTRLPGTFSFGYGGSGSRRTCNISVRSNVSGTVTVIATDNKNGRSTQNITIP